MKKRAKPHTAMSCEIEANSGLAERARRIGALAGLLVRRVRLLGWVGMASASWLWLVLFVIVGNIPHFLLAIPAAAVGLILLLPSAAVLLATLGLHSLSHLPQRLGSATLAPSSAAPKQRRGPIALLRKLWAIRREILGHKLALVRYAGAVRLFTVPVLLLISLAILACLFQLLLAVLSLPLVLITLLN